MARSSRPALAAMPSDVRALIDRIAAALGPDATPERVERVARAVLDARPPAAPRARLPAGPAGVGPADGATRVVVTAYGHDQPGVLAAITAELSASGANVLDVSQKVLQGYFTVVLVADLADGTGPRRRPRRARRPAARRWAPASCCSTRSCSRRCTGRERGLGTRDWRTRRRPREGLVAEPSPGGPVRSDEAETQPVIAHRLGSIAEETAGVLRSQTLGAPAASSTRSSAPSTAPVSALPTSPMPLSLTEVLDTVQMTEADAFDIRTVTLGRQPAGVRRAATPSRRGGTCTTG